MRDNIENKTNVTVMPGRSQQKNWELKRAEQSCLTFTRPVDQSSTNESLCDVTSKNMQEESGKQKWNYVFLKMLISYSALLRNTWIFFHVIL